MLRDDLQAIHETIDATPFGMWALDSMRIEKGHPAWGSDLSPPYTLREVGAERFTSDPGAAPDRALTILKLDDCGYDSYPMSPVSLGGRLVDEVTSTAFGHRIGKPVAMVILSCAGAPPGTEVEVQVFGRRIPARVHGDAPLYDPANERLRA